MNDSMNKSLLAVLLAISELDNPLNSKEKNDLSVIAQQLSLMPAAWNTDIEPNLMEIIGRNPSLNRIFQEIKFKIENISISEITSKEELAKVIPTKLQPSERPIPIFDDPNEEIPGIINLSYAFKEFVSLPEESKTIKGIEKIRKFKNFIHQMQKLVGRR
ncbi:MAG: hypothetical protein MGF17_14350 [Trichodesmium sp. MAG_R04]|nr:hypothetical protein [Trichodesmium sp. MAG_R04]